MLSYHPCTAGKTWGRAVILVISNKVGGFLIVEAKVAALFPPHNVLLTVIICKYSILKLYALRDFDMNRIPAVYSHLLVYLPGKSH